MIFELSSYEIIVLNIIGAFLANFGIAFIFSKFPYLFFNKDFFILKTFSWENEGQIWNQLFKVKTWKKKLPDGAAWFKDGFSKKNIKIRSPEYFNRFKIETNRAELSHWTSIFLSPLFFLFNPMNAGMIMIIYTLISNLPCILAQRVNRPWFTSMSHKLNQ